MAKDTRIAFRASAELKARLAKASKKLKLGETALAEAAVEAAIEYVEEHGGIWFPLRVVPDPESSPPPGKAAARRGQRTAGPMDVEAAREGSRSSASPPSSKISLNEDAPVELTPVIPARPKSPSVPRARSTRGIKHVVGREQLKP